MEKDHVEEWVRRKCSINIDVIFVDVTDLTCNNDL
jgi:spermidine synthase